MVGTAILIMEQKQEDFQKMVIEIPQSYTLEDLMNFLKKNKKIPFNNFFLTNKPAKRAHFTPDRKMHSLIPECQQLDGNMVLLCYQMQVQQSIRETSQPQIQQVHKEKRRIHSRQSCCGIM